MHRVVALSIEISALMGWGIAQEPKGVSKNNSLSLYSKTSELTQMSRPATFAPIVSLGIAKPSKEIMHFEDRVSKNEDFHLSVERDFWKRNYPQIYASLDSIRSSIVPKISKKSSPSNGAYVSEGWCLIPLVGCIIGADILRKTSLQDSEKISGWKRAGIVGAEFIGGFGATYISFCLAFMSNYPDLPEERKFLSGYMIGSTLAGGTIIWGTGRLFGHKGSLWKSMIGAGLGSILGGWVWNHFDPLRHSESFLAPEILMITAPALGAVTGNNL